VGSGAMGGFAGKIGNQLKMAGTEWGRGDIYIAVHPGNATADLFGGGVAASRVAAVYALLPDVSGCMDTAARGFGGGSVRTTDALWADGGKAIGYQIGCSGRAIPVGASRGIEGGDISRATRTCRMVLPESSLGILADVHLLPAGIFIHFIFGAEVPRIHGFYGVQSGDRGRWICRRVEVQNLEAVAWSGKRDVAFHDDCARRSSRAIAGSGRTHATGRDELSRGAKTGRGAARFGGRDRSL